MSRRSNELQPAHRRRAGGRFSRRAVFLTFLSAFVLVVAGVAAWRMPTLRPVRGPSGTVLGRLPAGISVSDLNVVLITLDTTRADRIGAYGFTGIETPNLDRLAREGVLFENATAAAPLTLPAHTSLFTGKLPPQHNVRDNGGFFLHPRQTTFASLLKDHR